MASVKTKTINRFPEDRPEARARALLARAVGFRDCEGDVLDALVAAGQVRALGRGEYALRRGDHSPGVWFIVQGLVEASLIHSDGQHQLLGLLLPGDFFNLMGVVDGSSSEYDVSAREASTALVVPLAEMRRLRDLHASLVRACEKQFVFRARLLQKRLAVDPSVSLDARAASMLRLLAVVYGHETDQGVEFSVRLTQTDMADWLGLSRQRMNFVLKQLEADGLIRLHYSSLVIVDPAGLAQRADQ